MPQPGQFTPFSKFLHWTMAAMVLAMLGIGVTMVVSVRHYAGLVAIHRPLGILILAFVVVRIANRLTHRAPPLPPTVLPPERVVALASEVTLYALMVLMPLVGWGMLSAADYPVVLWGPVRLPPILPHNATLYSVLRRSHTVLAYPLFFVFLGHLAAVLFHTLVVRDGLLWRMAPSRSKPVDAAPK
jgi:cytochrome b561